MPAPWWRAPLPPPCFARPAHPYTRGLVASVPDPARNPAGRDARQHPGPGAAPAAGLRRLRVPRPLPARHAGVCRAGADALRRPRPRLRVPAVIALEARDVSLALQQPGPHAARGGRRVAVGAGGRRAGPRGRVRLRQVQPGAGAARPGRARTPARCACSASPCCGWDRRQRARLMQPGVPGPDVLVEPAPPGARHRGPAARGAGRGGAGSKGRRHAGPGRAGG